MLWMLAGARVILACRNVERANAARDDIIKSTGNDDVIVMTLDLASLRSVRQFAEDFNRSALSMSSLTVNVHGVSLGVSCRNGFYFLVHKLSHCGYNARTLNGDCGLWS